MPVTVIVGGQFGSEGKGKVAYEFARMQHAAVAVRVGGSNSGHTVVDPIGTTHVFRHLPTGCLLPNIVSVIGAGSYVDPEVLISEIKRANLTPERLIIDENVVLISDRHKKSELDDDLRGQIGSTGSGTGAAVVSRIRRDGFLDFADAHPFFVPFIGNASSFLREKLRSGKRVIIEGTQGFGLSLLHSRHYPKVTSRDTTAAGFVSEAGVSPLDVDEIVMVIRAFPIRVEGKQSGILPHEISWEQLQVESGYPDLLVERTTVTQKIRRVARFDCAVVKESIVVNRPTKIVLNHADYFDFKSRNQRKITNLAHRGVAEISRSIGQTVDYVGIAPDILLEYCDVREGNKC